MDFIFKLTPKLANWCEEHQKVCINHNIEDAQFEFCFAPSEFVDSQTVRCTICGEEKTEYID